MPELWFLRDDAEISYKLDRSLLRNAKLGVPNSMDVAIAQAELRDTTNSLTSDDVPFIERFVFIDGLQPRTDIFRIEESPTYILVADPVAEGVLRAGCTRMEFADPADLQHGMRVKHYRTVDGIAQRRVHFLD